MKKSILFVINPISGGKSKINFPALVNQHLDNRKFIPSYIYTKNVGHASTIATENTMMDIIVAVGGDGTINEVASVLESSHQCMGIIPYGSGNGLARSIGLPLSIAKAISRLNHLRVFQMDTGVLNNRKFFNIAGTGFDAHISQKFAQHPGRGLNGYIQSAFREISTYHPQNYTLYIDGIKYQRNAFMISIANSSQYGNNAHISPFASLEDGLLDICIIRPFPLYMLPFIGLRMFNRTAHCSKFVEIIKGRNIIINREKADLVHVDGEPLLMNAELEIFIKPLSLKVLS
ncbi:MAG: YegS/Rv2252/BmrU family lipid kinase [Flavobacterium sp.]|nr:YegS/Rv2252/BmrU family lipid kinase [Pedobacter sp.]